MNRFDLPLHWSPEQVLAVYECVEQLRELLWLNYHDELQRALGCDAADDLQPTARAPQIDLLDIDDGEMPF
jgi:hypothetical protein